MKMRDDAITTSTALEIQQRLMNQYMPKYGGLSNYIELKLCYRIKIYFLTFEFF